jgi:hypothetical protein
MNAGKFKVFMKNLFVALSLFALATLLANAELLVGISFPSQGGADNDVVAFDSSAAADNDSIQIDESLLTLPKLHLQDSSWFGVEYRTLSLTIISFSLHDDAFTNVVDLSYSYSPGPANFNQVRSYFQGLTTQEQLASLSVSAEGTPDSSASDSSISGPASPTAAQPVTGILGVTLNQDTLRLDWPADHIGWILQTRTNLTINSQWFPILGSNATNHLDLILDRANTSVFFRLMAP